MPSRSPGQSAAPAAPSKWQSAATAALIVHLFCLGLAILSNVGGGVSRVGYSLRKIPLAPQYLKLLGMDTAYDFDLGGTSREDAVHRLEVARPGAEEPLASLPDEEVHWRIRRQRYRRLADYVAELDAAFAENADLRTMLPLAIADAWLQDLDLPPQRYVLTCPSDSAPRWAAAPEEQPERSPTATEGAVDESVAGTSDGDAPDDLVAIDLVWNAQDERYEGARRQPPALTAKAIPEASDSATDAEVAP